MKLLSKNEASEIESEYSHLTSLENNIGKIKAVVTTLNEQND